MRPRLDQVEWLLDRAPIRLAARAVARRRARRSWLGPAAPLPPQPRTPRERLEALETFLAGAAHGRAAELADDLLERMGALEPDLRTRAWMAIIQTLVAVGDERATALARAQASRLSRDARGASLLDALELRRTPSPWLPDGRANLLLAARRIEEGELDAEALAVRWLRRPAVWVRQPQAHLVLAHALMRADAPAAGRALSRFLDAHTVAPVRIDPGEGNVLARSGPARREPRVDGSRTVSVVVAAYRARHTIDYAIDSLLDQTYRPLEILACDDASDDGTAERLRERYGGLPEVRLFRSVANQGPYGIRNALLREARGELLTFHDADDLALPSRIADQVGAMRRARAEASVGRFLRVTASGRFVFFHDQSCHRLSVASLMMTRAAYEAVGPYRVAAFGADHELLEALRDRCDGRVAYLRRPVHLGLWSEGSLTRAPGSESLESGYRSPKRRLYAELVYERRHGLVTEREMAARLDDAGVLREPQDVVPLD